MEQPPTPTNADRAHAGAKALVKGAAGIVPVAGGFLAEIVDLLYKEPIERRRDEWLQDVADVLAKLESRQAELTPEALAADPEFVTVLHKATEVAVRTHQVEKRRQLRSAIMNSALPGSLDVDKKLHFLRLIDELTPSHVLVLGLYRDPLGWFKSHGHQPKEFYSAGRDEVVKQAYPELASSAFFNELVLGELNRRGLMQPLGGLVSSSGVYDPVTTPLGNEFLDFIRIDAA